MRLPKYTIPLFVLTSILAILAGGGYFLLTAGRGIGQFMFGRGYAESQLRDYVTSVMRDQVRGVNCQAYDTDDNGYVSCDFTTESQQDKLRSIECAAWGWRGFWNRGCRSRFPNL
jgi:hypothetical protein